MSSGSPPLETTLADATSDVFGRWRPGIAWAVIVAFGLTGWCLAAWVVGADAGSREWLRPWACAGYGISVGGLMTLVPRLWSVVTLNASLRRRPTRGIADDDAAGWWPLRLVAAALRHTPRLRITAQDFTSAAGGLVVEAGNLLARRSWPACVSAFTAPVLGLVSAWCTWGRYISEIDIDRQAVAANAAPFGSVAWPMILTILAGLVVMFAVVAIDQMTRGLLQRWSMTVRFEDVAPLVGQAEPGFSGPTTPGGGGSGPGPGPVIEKDRGSQDSKGPAPQPDLSGLGEVFHNG